MSIMYIYMEWMLGVHIGWEYKQCLVFKTISKSSKYYECNIQFPSYKYYGPAL